MHIQLRVFWNVCQTSSCQSFHPQHQDWWLNLWNDATTQRSFSCRVPLKVPCQTRASLWTYLKILLQEMEPLKCSKGLGGIQQRSPHSYVQKQRPVTNLQAYLIPSTTRLSLYWQRRRPGKREATAQHEQQKREQREKEITLSFILQLCAKALEPSIFSRCRFFMKASGNSQSFMSASSSTVTPTAGERSRSESIFIRALQEGKRSS